MTLNKRRSKGGGRKKLKRDGALKDQPVGIGIWSGDEVEKIEALLRHRQSNLERAIQKGYHPAAIGRYSREVRAAKAQIENLVNQRLDQEETDAKLADAEEERESNIRAIRAQRNLERKIKHLVETFEKRRSVH